MARLQASVIIPTRNRPEKLRRLFSFCSSNHCRLPNTNSSWWMMAPSLPWWFLKGQPGLPVP